MPELPEVEIVKKSLKKNVKDKKILDVIVTNRNLRFKVDKDFEKILKNRKIQNVNRYAKNIIVELNGNIYVIIHLGMTGTFHLIRNNILKNTNLSFYQSKDLPIKHNHIVLIFKKFRVIYNDPRRFGFFKLLKDKESFKLYLKNIGYEPLDKNFNLKYLKKSILFRKKCIKSILLDQKIISGIGNIYANEILFHSGLNPRKKGLKLKDFELKYLYKYSKLVLKKAILKGGSSIRDFRNTEGAKGSFQDNFKVYDKDNHNCPNKKCNYKIKKINISNRSTFYCENCQK
tara:strand:- start:210 stop:1070 length:861 start_codon:yes stop_codon:yes gene_type:complete